MKRDLAPTRRAWGSRRPNRRCFAGDLIPAGAPAASAACRSGLPRGRLKRGISKAIAWLKDHYEQAIKVAYKVGYESPSQFSREYRRLFGAPPMQDIKKLRTTL